MSAQVTSFVEEACHVGDRLRDFGPEAVFQLESVGKILGRRGNKFRLRETIRGNLRIWYDPADALILSMLLAQTPDVEWERYVFWRKADHSAIEIIDPDDDTIAARLVIRRGPPAGPETDWTNVVCPVRPFGGS